MLLQPKRLSGSLDAREIEGLPYTILDYLSLAAPRTSNKEGAFEQMVAGHANYDPRNPIAIAQALDQVKQQQLQGQASGGGDEGEGGNGTTAARLDPDDYEIDWWCGRKSVAAVQMRTSLLGTPPTSLDMEAEEAASAWGQPSPLSAGATRAGSSPGGGGEGSDEVVSEESSNSKRRSMMRRSMRRGSSVMVVRSDSLS